MTIEKKLICWKCVAVYSNTIASTMCVVVFLSLIGYGNAKQLIDYF